MALPSKSKQIKLIADLLEKLDGEEGEGLTFDDIAKRVVESYHRILSPRSVPPPPHTGMAFSTPFHTKVNFVAWKGEERAWVVNEDSHYGFLLRLDDEDYWSRIEEAPDRRRKKEDDLGLYIPRPGEPGNNPDWKVGNRASLSQRQATFEIVATGDKCALMRELTQGYLTADSNTNMAKYYRKEGK